MQEQLNSIKYTSTIVPDDIRKNMLMKKVLVFVQAKEEHPELTKPQICKMIGISDSSLKRIMKDLNMKSFYRHDVPVNKKYTSLTVNKKSPKDGNVFNEGSKKLQAKLESAKAKSPSKGGAAPKVITFPIYESDIPEDSKSSIINLDDFNINDYMMKYNINKDKTTSLFKNNTKKLSDRAITRVKDIRNK